MSIWSDFIANDGLRTTKYSHYLPIYERHLSRFVNLDVTLFEIGVWQGGSLELWKKFLGPHARIVGIDNNPDCIGAEQDQISVRIGDQADARFLDSVVAEFGAPAIVIDDGAHQLHAVTFSFDHLFPLLPTNSVYVVEDTHSCYMREFGAGSGAVSFLDRTKQMIDAMHAHYTRGRIRPSELTRSLAALHVYDSIVVIEKQRVNRRCSFTGHKQLFGDEINNAKAADAVMRFIEDGTPVDLGM